MPKSQQLIVSSEKLLVKETIYHKFLIFLGFLY